MESKGAGFEAKTSVQRRMNVSTVAETMRGMTARVAGIAVAMGLHCRKSVEFLALQILYSVEIRELLHSISCP